MDYKQVVEQLQIVDNCINDNTLMGHEDFALSRQRSALSVNWLYKNKYITLEQYNEMEKYYIDVLSKRESDCLMQLLREHMNSYENIDESEIEEYCKGIQKYIYMGYLVVWDNIRQLKTNDMENIQYSSIAIVNTIFKRLWEEPVRAFIEVEE